MQWLGFGKGFVFNEDSICINNWTDAQRELAMAARRASMKAHRSTQMYAEPSDLAVRGSSLRAMIHANAILDSETGGMGGLPTKYIHAMAAEKHIETAKFHRDLGGTEHKKAARLHKKAADAHIKAGLEHTQTSEVDWRPNEMTGEDYYS